MKNHNVYEFTGNIESAIKNGDIRQIILFSGINLSTFKFLNSFENKKEVEPTNDFPYKQILIKHRSPFRIGEIQTRLIYLDNIFSSKIDKKALESAIKDISKKFKNSMILFPIQGSLTPFRNDILNCLNDNTFNTKIIILN